MSTAKASDDYTDPENVDVQLTVLQNIARNSDENAGDEIEKFIRELFPTWLVAQIGTYSPDYPILRSNWKIICESAQTSPKKIVLVDKITFDEHHKITMMFAEVMTRYGYCVRQTCEFLRCPKCTLLIPRKVLWDRMKEMKVWGIPDEWSDTCSGCK